MHLFDLSVFGRGAGFQQGNRKFSLRRLRYRAGYMKAFSRRRREDVIAKLGGRCASSSCLVPGGCIDARVLQVDHVHDDGASDGTRNDPRALFHKVMADNSGRYQLLCANCNVTKEHERRIRDQRASVRTKAEVH